MMKRALVALIMTAVFALGMIQPALAAKSLSKSYKVSVTLPEMVGTMPDELAQAKVTVWKLTDPRRHTEETVIVLDGQQVLLRTTVVQ